MFVGQIRGRRRHLGLQHRGDVHHPEGRRRRDGSARHAEQERDARTRRLAARRRRLYLCVA